MKKTLTAFIVSLTLLVFAGSAFAVSASLKIDSFTFDASNGDVIGANGSTTADGKPDAAFRLSVSGAHAIKRIIVKNDTTGKVWSTSPQSTGAVLIVKDSNGSVLNTGNSMKITPVLIQGEFSLYVDDVYSVLPKDSKLTATIVMIDGKQATATTSASAVVSKAPAKKPDEKKPEQGKPQTKPEQVKATGDGIASAEVRGVSDQDFAGKNERIRSDGNNDTMFTVKLNFKKATVTGVKLTAENSGKTMRWDTVADNKAPALIVVDSGSSILNKTNGTVSFNVSGTADYTIYVQDTDNILADPATKATVSITLADGRIIDHEAARARKVIGKDSAEAEYEGIGKYDFVSGTEKMQQNFNPDRLINISFNTIGTISGIRIKDVKTGRTWDTIPDNKNAVIAVVDGKSDRLNAKDGNVSLKVKDEGTFQLWFDEEDTKAVGPYEVTLVMANGQLISAQTGEGKTSLTTADRAVKFVSKKPAVIGIDSVGKNKKKASNGAKDHSLSISITGKGVIKAMTLTNTAGKGWDTTPSNNGRWLLGVRQNGKLLNAKNGSVKVNVNGTKTYQLLMQDNGILKAKKGKLTLSCTWGDGQFTETTLSW